MFNSFLILYMIDLQERESLLGTASPINPDLMHGLPRALYAIPFLAIILPGLRGE